MTPVLRVPPALEPVPLAELRQHLRIDTSDEDALLAEYLAAARDAIERALGLALIEQAWSLFLDGWPLTLSVDLSIWPIISLDKILVHGAGGSVEVEASTYTLCSATRPACVRIEAAAASMLPEIKSRGIEIQFTAGFGGTPESIPAALRQAIRILAALSFETRVPLSGATDPELFPPLVRQMLAPYRQVRL